MHPYSSRAFEKYQEHGNGHEASWFGKSHLDKTKQNKIPCFIHKFHQF
jgi:hypothetical protein